MQLRLKTGRRSQVWLPSFSRSDAALGLTEMESCLKATRVVYSGFLMGLSFSSSIAQALLAQWAEWGARPHCSGSLAGNSQHPGESCFFWLWVPQSHLSFGKQPQLWERVQFLTIQRTESQEADFTFRILREGPVEFIPAASLTHSIIIFSFGCFFLF